MCRIDFDEIVFECFKIIFIWYMWILGKDMVVEKSAYNAHLGSLVWKRRRKRWVWMTNLCCETTAHETFIRGFRVFFSADASATSDLDLHEATLKNMAYGFAYFLDCHRLKQALP
ncbi:putative nicotinamidase [Medicago truncatula]|uniref:Putative nicotinamidase n=1 Tax=Medicago truncatula TaxID=3880 RepID=A0A396JJG5_MEDTR|nr:putative nicotinamidase [Medicago truncatula]